MFISLFRDGRAELYVPMLSMKDRDHLASIPMEKGADADVVYRSCPALNLQITIYNLLSLLRKGPASTQNKAEGIILSATLEVSSVAVHVGYLRQKRVLRLKGDIWAQIERITFNLKVSANVSVYRIHSLFTQIDSRMYWTLPL